jgi:multidrug efflux pump subunit AcrA (membrane-fusion protein)
VTDERHAPQPEGSQPEGSQPEGSQPEGYQPEGDQPERFAWTSWGCLIPLLLLFAALLVGVLMYVTRDVPQPEPAEQRALVVRTEVVRRAEHRLDVSARGRVLAARQAVILPQVGGRIVEVGTNLVPGSLVRRGELLVRIDPEDFQLAVRQAESRLAEAEAELALERGRQQVAEEEWRLYQQAGLDDSAPSDAPSDTASGAPDGAAEQPSPLALREPQQQVIVARMQAARAQLDQARLELQRTIVRAPFDALVLRERAAIGQLTGPQHEIAELAASAQLRVHALLRFDQVDAIAIPGVNAEIGSPVRVYQDLGAHQLAWQGRVQRLLGDVQPEGQMARVLVVVDDPFNAAAAGTGPQSAAMPVSMPLLIGASVGVEIEGRRVEQLVEVPRRALREGDRILVVDDDDRLSVRHPDIAWRLPHSVLVRDGVADGERVVTSPVEAAIDGMLVREEAVP